MKKKKCSSCGEVKRIKHFHKSQIHKDGFNWVCKECRSVYCHEWYMERRYKSPKPRKCVNCGLEFTPIGKAAAQRKYCSKKCANEMEQKKLPERNRSIRRKRWMRISSKIHIIGMSDKYMKELISDQLGIKFEDITPEIISLKREQLKLSRSMKAIKHRGMEKTKGGTK